MKRIGLTGGIGSGKSTVARVFKLLGVPVYPSDERAKWLMEHDPELKRNIIAAFGSEISPGGQIDRQKLAELVFPDAEKLKQLNALVHPAVALDFEYWCNRQQAAFIIKEAAIIFETGIDRQLDGVIVVAAPDELRIRRVMERSGISEQAVRQRMQQQWPQEELVKRAGWLIKNDETTLLIPHILAIFDALN